MIELGEGYDENLAKDLDNEFFVEKLKSPDIDQEVLSDLNDKIKKFNLNDSDAILFFTDQFSKKFKRPIEVLLENVADFDFVFGYIKYALVSNLDVKIRKKNRWNLCFHSSYNTQLVLKHFSQLIKKIIENSPSQQTKLARHFAQTILKKIIIVSSQEPTLYLQYAQNLLPYSKITFQIFTRASCKKNRNLIMPIFANLLNRVGIEKFKKKFEEENYSGKLLRESVFQMAGYVSYADFNSVHTSLKLQFTYSEFKECLSEGNHEVIGLFLSKNFPFYIARENEVTNLFRMALHSNIKPKLLQALHENIQKAKGVDPSLRKVMPFVIEKTIQKNRYDALSLFFYNYITFEGKNILKNHILNLKINSQPEDQKVLKYLEDSGIIGKLMIEDENFASEFTH